jgi:hypothetical protein
MLGPDNSSYWLDLGLSSLRQAAGARLREVRHGA